MGTIIQTGRGERRMSESDHEQILGMPESTCYALLAYKEGRKAQVWFYFAGFFTGITSTLLVLELWPR